VNEKLSKKLWKSNRYKDIPSKLKDLLEVLSKPKRD
jgi:hypothetical protein